jgi:hypothetical protein
MTGKRSHYLAFEGKVGAYPCSQSSGLDYIDFIRVEIVSTVGHHEDLGKAIL